MADCVFCRIVRGELPAHKLYEDEHSLAFLDIHPLTRGHALVIPRLHAERFEDLPEDAAAKLWRAVRRVAPAIGKAVGAAATTLAINNGKEAGQEVPHVHVHVVPRDAADGAGPIHALFRQRPTVASDEFAALAERVRKSLGPFPKPAT